METELKKRRVVKVPLRVMALAIPVLLGAGYLVIQEAVNQIDKQNKSKK